MSEDTTLDEFINEKNQTAKETSEPDLMTSLDETSVGEIPDDWSTARLGELTRDTLYGANESAEEYVPEKPRYIRIKDIDDQGRLKKEDKASLSQEKAEGYFLKKGDMLFARSGSPGRTYLHRYNDGEYCYGGYSIKHEFVSEGLNKEYLAQYTKSQKYWDWIERIARTGAQANINSGEYASLLVPLPPVSEQGKITTILDNIDQLIQKTDNIIRKREKVKQGLMQDIFRYGIGPGGEFQSTDDDEYQETKYGSAPKGWEIVALENIVADDASITYGIVKPGDHYPGGVPVVKVENITNGQVQTNELLHTDPEIHDKYDRAELGQGDLLFTIRGTVGRMAFVPESLEGGNLTQDTARIRVEDADPEFVHYYLETATPNNYFERHTKGQAVQGINLEDLQKVPVHLPPVEEQERIVAILDSHTEALRNEREYKQQLERLKRGLMQDLLSGKVRTTDTNIEMPAHIMQHG